MVDAVACRLAMMRPFTSLLEWVGSSGVSSLEVGLHLAESGKKGRRRLHIDLFLT
jgi:hypothetical protein